MKQEPLSPLGAQEMEILRYITENTPASVRTVAQHFEKEKGLARTTIQTVMERLREKGFLSRKKDNGLFVYTAKIETNRILQSKVKEFVESTLGGSLNPIMNYFLDSKNLTQDEVEQLRVIAEKLVKPENRK